MKFIGSLLFSYDGRILRWAFWLGLGLSFLIDLALAYAGTGLDIVFHTEPILDFAMFRGLYPFQAYLPVLSLYCLIAVVMKRLHDRDKSARFVLLALIPVLGAAWLLIEGGFLPGTNGPNEWGDDPRQPGPAGAETIL